MNRSRSPLVSQRCLSGLVLVLAITGCQVAPVAPAPTDAGAAAVTVLPEVLPEPAPAEPPTRRPPPVAEAPRQLQRKVAACAGREFRLRELAVETLQVANQDVGQLLNVLQTLGYETVRIEAEKAAAAAAPVAPRLARQPPGQAPGAVRAGAAVTAVAKRYGCDQLPVVVMPPPVAEDRLAFGAEDFLGLAGASLGSRASGSSSYRSSGSRAGGSYGTPSGDTSPALHALSKPHSGEVDNLLVFYHPAQVDELRALESLVRQRLDVQASQVYIEGLVLEVSEEGLRELGVQFNRVDPDGNRTIGIGALGVSPVAGGGAQIFSFVRDSLLRGSALRDQVKLQIQALVGAGAAEVLSRPSVLTLNNRQATIQIIDIVQFPIQEATITASGDIVQSAFTFEAVRPGITLNLRPRVSADSEFVSLEIDVTVEALVAANNGEVRNDAGLVIATKPGSSARRVQTFARIPDRTPIIIGGLISSDKEETSNRLPILGDLPIIGALFGATQKTFGKREVIIVLTPYVVGQDSVEADVSRPKDTALFDVKDATLFADSYRIRSEDVYDLQFLVASPDFVARRQAIERLRERHPDLVNRAPYREFLDGNVPGGENILSRMLLDLVRRRDFGSGVDVDQLIVLRNTPSGTPEVGLLKNLFAQVMPADGQAGQPGERALVIEFGENATVDGSPAAVVRVMQRPAGRTWEAVLWELSYGAAGDGARSAIILRDQSDLDILRDAVVGAAVLDRNGGYENLNVGNFRQGTTLSIPSFDAERFYLVDAKVARMFADRTHYYRAAARALERAYRDMDDGVGMEALLGAAPQPASEANRSTPSTLPPELAPALSPEAPPGPEPTSLPAMPPGPVSTVMPMAPAPAIAPGTAPAAPAPAAALGAAPAAPAPAASLGAAPAAPALTAPPPPGSP